MDTHAHTGTWTDSNTPTTLCTNMSTLVSEIWKTSKQVGSRRFLQITLFLCLWIIIFKKSKWYKLSLQLPVCNSTLLFHRSKNYPRKDGKNAPWKQFQCLTLINTITHMFNTHTYTCTRTKTYKPDFSEQSCGPSVTPESALSRLVAVGSLFLCQPLSPCVWGTSNSMCSSYPFSTCHYHGQGLKQAPRGY